MTSQSKASSDAISEMSVSYSATGCFQAEGETLALEPLRGNWMQRRDGITRIKVPVLRADLRPSMTLVASKELEVNELPQDTRLREGVMHRGFLRCDSPQLRGCLMSCTFYVPAGGSLAGTQSCTVEVDFPFSDPEEEMIRAAELAILELTCDPMIPSIGLVMAPDVIPLNDERATMLERAGALGPFSSNSNG